MSMCFRRFISRWICPRRSVKPQSQRALGGPYFHRPNAAATPETSSVPSVTFTTTWSAFSAVSAWTGGRMMPICGLGSWKLIVSAPSWVRTKYTPLRHCCGAGGYRKDDRRRGVVERTEVIKFIDSLTPEPGSSWRHRSRECELRPSRRSISQIGRTRSFDDDGGRASRPQALPPADGSQLECFDGARGTGFHNSLFSRHRNSESSNPGWRSAASSASSADLQFGEQCGKRPRARMTISSQLFDASADSACSGRRRCTRATAYFWAVS